MSERRLSIAAEVLAMALLALAAVRLAVTSEWPLAMGLALAVGLMLGLRFLGARSESSELAAVRAVAEEAKKEAAETKRALAAILQTRREESRY